MQYILLICFFFSHIASIAQSPDVIAVKKDSLIIVPKNPSKGFYNDYILFVPKGTPIKKKIFLLVEPNNTGSLSDSMEVHKSAAIALASVSSVGNNVSTELRIPLLVPVFPRPESQPLMYTHALDRDVMLERTPALQRPDLQLLEMISDAKKVLLGMEILVDPKIFMNGFSASATFTNRFSFLHPGMVKALAIGGFNGDLMFPEDEVNNVKLNYPIGTYDFRELFKSNFDAGAFRQIPQLIYMGKLDENDAVQYDDAYDEKERKIVNENIGAKVQERYMECQRIYKKHNINANFKSYEEVGHWTTPNMNLEVIKFFLAQMGEKQ